MFRDVVTAQLAAGAFSSSSEKLAAAWVEGVGREGGLGVVRAGVLECLRRAHHSADGVLREFPAEVIPGNFHLRGLTAFFKILLISLE